MGTRSRTTRKLASSVSTLSIYNENPNFIHALTQTISKSLEEVVLSKGGAYAHGYSKTDLSNYRHFWKLFQRFMKKLCSLDWLIFLKEKKPTAFMIANTDSDQGGFVDVLY